MWKKWGIIAGVGLVVIVAIVVLGLLFSVGRRWSRANYGPGFNRGMAYGPMWDRGGFGPMGGPGYSFGPGQGWGREFGPNRGPGGFSDRLRGPGPDMPRPGNLGGLRGWGGPANSMIEIIARELDLTPSELLTELRDGRTVAEVAAAQDVALDTIVEAILAPRAERLAELVTEEQLTQAEVDTRLTVLRVDLIDWLNESWFPQDRPEAEATEEPEGN